MKRISLGLAFALGLALVSSAASAQSAVTLYDKARKVIEPANPLAVTVGSANSPTYAALASAYAAYATPTDLACIWGSASKTIRIQRFSMSVSSTATALQTVDFVKRSTADTGGTPTTLTATTYDSADAAATASVATYAAAPTLGTTVGTLVTAQGSSTVPTSAPGSLSNCSINVVGICQTTTSFDKPFVLRGVGEGVCINYRGAALTSGFSANVYAEWTEQ